MSLHKQCKGSKCWPSGEAKACGCSEGVFHALNYWDSGAVVDPKSWGLTADPLGLWLNRAKVLDSLRGTPAQVYDHTTKIQPYHSRPCHESGYPALKQTVAVILKLGLRLEQSLNQTKAVT